MGLLLGTVGRGHLTLEGIWKKCCQWKKSHMAKLSKHGNMKQKSWAKSSAIDKPYGYTITLCHGDLHLMFSVHYTRLPAVVLVNKPVLTNSLLGVPCIQTQESSRNWTHPYTRSARRGLVIVPKMSLIRELTP